MRKHPNGAGWRRKFWWISLLLMITGLLFLKPIWSTAAAPGASTQTDTPYPTNYPPAKQTLEAIDRQTQAAAALTGLAQDRTQAAAALTPSPTGTHWKFLTSTPTLGPWELTPFPSTPAGDGEILDFDEGSLSKLIGVNIINKWYAEIGDRHFNIFAGSDYNDPAQGMVYVILFAADGAQLSNGDYYPTADRSGAVQVVGAVGSRLVLRSTGGETYYFDVPGQRFTASLTETVPTVTPLPYTPRPPLPTRTTAFTDDAPNTPNDIRGLSPVNMTLTYTISPSGDADWFRFNLPAPGTIQVQLTNLPANYDVYVYEVSVPNGGQSTQSGTTDEIVTIPDAPADDYIVRVVGVNGAFDSTHPYRLRFNTLASPVLTETPPG